MQPLFLFYYVLKLNSFIQSAKHIDLVKGSQVKLELNSFRSYFSKLSNS